MPAPIRAVAYYRMSDDRQENSIARQRSQVIPFAETHGYEILRDYLDEGIAGDQIIKRHQFQRMLRDAQAGQFQAILCDDKDRFGRFDAIDLGEIVAPLRRKGVWIETVAQGRIDWNTFAGRITDAILQEAKSMESEAISRRVLSSQLLKARNGMTTGGRAPYGYRWEPDPARGQRLVPHGRPADVVRLAFRMYAEGKTLFTIAEELYCRAVPSPRGKDRWTRTVVQRLLTNRRYVGDWTWGVHPQGKRHHFGSEGLGPTTRGQKRQRRNPADAWLVIPDTHEALIDRDTFERVQARLRDNKMMTTPHPAGGNFVLNRLLVCGHCGSFLNGVTVGKQRVYVCRGYLAYGRTYCKRNAVSEASLVRFLVRKLRETFLDPANLKRLREEMAAQQAEEGNADNLGRLRRRADYLLEKIDRGNERLLILPTDRVPGVVEIIREWERDRRDALTELTRVQSTSAVDNLEATIAAAEAALWRLQEALTDADVPLLRETFREMLSRVELEWSHQEMPTRTRAKLKGGVVWLRAHEGSAELYPSAGR